MPWNYPYYQVARFAAPNLMAGNTIILKHAPQCPESALAMEQVFRDAGLADDAYINVFATNEPGRGYDRRPAGGGVSVTGSERAGAAVAEVAGRNLKKVVLELGGSDPFIVLDSDDVTKAVKAAVAGPDGQRRPGVQRGQADHRRRRSVRRVRRPVHRRDGRACARVIPRIPPRTSGRCPRRGPPSG